MSSSPALQNSAHSSALSGKNLNQANFCRSSRRIWRKNSAANLTVSAKHLWCSILRRLCGSFLSDLSKHLFTFLRHPGVEPTNNHAEQSIRRLVIFRKISFGTRSQSGLKTHSVLPSLVLTAKRQGIDAMDFLKILLTKDTEIAQAALYGNTSWPSCTPEEYNPHAGEIASTFYDSSEMRDWVSVRWNPKGLNCYIWRVDLITWKPDTCYFRRKNLNWLYEWGLWKLNLKR